MSDQMPLQQLYQPERLDTEYNNTTNNKFTMNLS